MRDLALACGIGLWSVLVFWVGHEVGRMRGWAQGVVQESNRRAAERDAAKNAPAGCDCPGECGQHDPCRRS